MHDRERIEAIFLEAVQLAPEECQSFLDKECGDDLELRAEVEKLIAADRLAGDDAFLRTGLFGKDRDRASKEPTSGDDPADDIRFRALRRHRAALAYES